MLPFVGDKEDGSSSKTMQIEVQVDSDVETAADLTIDIDSRNDPQNVKETGVAMTYEHTFEVPLDTPFPLSGVNVEAASESTADWVSCRVVLDGEVIAEDRVSGSDQTAVCAKKLRVGPE